MTGTLSGNPQTEAEADAPWWADTEMDRDGNRLHDALDRALAEGGQGLLRDEQGRVGVLVDFDQMPTVEDEQALERAVDFQMRFRFHYIPIISGWVAADRVAELLEVPGVVFVSPNGLVKVLLDEARVAHGVEPTVWDMGFDGTGVSVAVIDTGIDGKHLGLDDMDDDPSTYDDPKVRGFYDAINAPDDKSGEVEPYDDHGHGSHVSGIVAGTGAGSEDNKYAGVAPGAWLVGVKVLDASGSGSFAQVMAGMEWVIDNRDKYNIRAATMSLGAAGVIELTQSQEERLTTLANEMVAAGIALTIAAGNDAGYGTIGTPGAARDVITVGATNYNRDLAIYSSKGPTTEGLIKPNVAAVGGGGLDLGYPGGGPGVMSVEANTGNGYRRMSGTSMAKPMVAGIVALMYQANPDLQPLMARSILEMTSDFKYLTVPMRPNNEYGWGFVEADSAMAEVIVLDTNLSVNIDPETPTITFTETFEENGTNYTVNSTRYLATHGQQLSFQVEGEANALQWRDVDLEDVWHTVEQNSGEWSIPIEPALFTKENMTVWVRAVSEKGYSAPLSLQIHIEPAAAETEESEGLPAIVYGLAGLVLLAGIGGYLLGNRRNGDDPAEEPD